MDTVLLLKLLITPVLTGFATWAGRKYGHVVTGLLVGFPFNAGPIAFFMALENGTQFAANSARGILLGIISLAFFTFSYAWLAKHLHWFGCVLLGWVAFFAATWLFLPLQLSVLPAYLLVLVVLALCLRFFPNFEPNTPPVQPPRWDIPLRILVATAFIVALTYAARQLGPQLSGLLTPFPIFGTIFAAFTHQLYGAQATLKLQRGVLVGLFGYTTFFLVVGWAIVPLGIGITFTLATLAAMAIQAGYLWQKKRKAGI